MRRFLILCLVCGCSSVESFRVIEHPVIWEMKGDGYEVN